MLHYLLSGDDRLMRQAISNFAASVIFEGLPQSRFPSHVPQIVAGFSLLWILQVCDHHLYFGDSQFARSFLPRIDDVLHFFDSHIDEFGLVSGLPEDVLHMLYAYVLNAAAKLVCDVGRPGYADEYKPRTAAVVAAVRQHCFDGSSFTDSTPDIADDMAFSLVKHLLLCAEQLGWKMPPDVLAAFADARFSKCSYMVQFYVLLAFTIAGYMAYEEYCSRVWNPWH
ncbi:alpha-L-rhamnosidase [Pochonia chlamydosporia 170]|uniref:Alpha-L-rhamnosidase n=1 Tax=Pochonia chlamydosporia 170 TaxID=1380566 RepID=A0A179F0J8_METCM|nr:alpha-L-rhamnosidase [Pochonia chlamydosporia 170]OAQ58974.1 alpha-L-rhamnosidase [Pochonia chlamydosporia 170]